MTESLLRSLIESRWRDARSKPDAPSAIGVQSDTAWQGPDVIAINGDKLRVVQCDSVLQAREALVSATGSGLVLVTSLTDQELGADVQARLVRNKLLRSDPMFLLRSHFRAIEYDASLIDKKPLLEVAAECLASARTDPAPVGVLTAEAVWKLVLREKLGIDDARPDAARWLDWSRDPDNTARWKTLSSELKPLLRDWMTSTSDDWFLLFSGCVDAGHGEQAIAIGLAMGVLMQEPHDTRDRVRLAQALGRLEQYCGNRALSPQAQWLWNQSAEQWARSRCSAGQAGLVMDQVAVADGILTTTGAASFASLGRWSGRGFGDRLETFASTAAQVAAGRASLAECEQQLDLLEAHELARWSNRERQWLECARMAARLVRWLQTAVQTPTDWASAVRLYQTDGQWVDTARQTLLAGDEPETVGRAWGAICGRAGERRERENARFASLLADVVARDSHGDAVVLIEQVLERVVAPWGKQKVLLVVMDAMSFAVWRELQGDVEALGWRSVSWSEKSVLPPALTVLPPVTTFSRCTLLTGRLASGGQDAEKRAFSENPDLVRVSKSGFPPILFHKDEVGSGSIDLAETVRKEIRRDDRRIVGVVINAIDDSLCGPEQRVFRWTIEQIPVLGVLLQEAQQAGRVAIITSDHGHVLDRGTTLRRSSTNDRYRSVDAGAAEIDEVRLAGRRVLDGRGEIVVLAGEQTRYTPSRRLGYHGGATPQECLVPIAVLVTGDEMVEGWVEVADASPEWWQPAEAAQVDKPAAKPARKKERVKPVAPLFDGVAAAERDWVVEFLASEVFGEQMRVAGGRLNPAQVEQAVRALNARNGVLMRPALAQKLDIPLFRMAGFLSSLQRVLNVDGYPVLSIDGSDTVRLDIGLLKTQFCVTT